MSKVYETVFEIAGKVAGSFDKSILDASKNLNRLNKQISALSPTDASINKFRELKTQLSSTETEYEQLGAQIAQMARQMHAAGPPTKRMSQEFDIAKLRAAQLKNSINEQKVALHQHRQALAASGIQTNNLHGSMQKLANQQRLSAAAQQRMIEIQQRAAAVEQRMIERQRQMIALQDRYTASVKNNQKAIEANLAARANIRGQAFDAVAVGTAAASPIVIAAQFEKAMLGVAKQVEGARDKSGKLTDVYYEMQKQIQILGRETPIATDQIAEMVAAGARMGVAKDELIGFTKTAAMMAAAFDLPAGELADQMGKIAGLYKIPIPAIGELADTINYLDDNAIAKGGDIITFLQRTGGLSGVVKVTGKEMAALGSTLLTMGETTETAGTAVNAMFSKFASATKGTDKFQTALREIGLSAEDIQSGMSTDAIGTFQRIADAINSLPEDERMGVMTELAGMEHADTLSKLAGGMEEFRKQLALANSEAAKGSMGREYQATLSTTTAQFQIMKNTMTEVAVNIGSVLLPGVNRVIGVIGSAATTVAEFARENQTLTAVIGTVVAGLAAVKVITLATSYAYTFLKGGLLQILSAVNVLRTAWLLNTGAMVANAATSKAALVLSRMLTAAQWLWNAALTANPIGLVIAAIAALIAAGVLLYKNWDEITAYAGELWTNVTAAFTNGMNMIGDMLANFSFVDFLLAPHRMMMDFINNIDLTESGAKIIETLANGIRNAAGKAVDAISETLAKVREYLPFSDAKVGPMSELTASGRAIVTTLGDGVNQATNGLTKPMAGALDQNLSAAAGGLGGSGGGHQFTFAPTIQVSSGSAEQIKSTVEPILANERAKFERQMDEWMRNNRRLSFV